MTMPNYAACLIEMMSTDRKRATRAMCYPITRVALYDMGQIYPSWRYSVDDEGLWSLMPEPTWTPDRARNVNRTETEMIFLNRDTGRCRRELFPLVLRAWLLPGYDPSKPQLAYELDGGRWVPAVAEMPKDPI